MSDDEGLQLVVWCEAGAPPGGRRGSYVLWEISQLRTYWRHYHRTTQYPEYMTISTGKDT